MARSRNSLVLIGLAMLTALAAPAGASAGVLAPESPSSPSASTIYDAYWVMLIIALILVATIAGAVLYAARRFRSDGAKPVRSGERGDSRGQLQIVGGLSTLAAAVFVIGVVFNAGANDVEPTGPNGLTEADPLELSVSGQRWLWRYEYPEELKANSDGPPLFSYHELVVPVDTAVELNIRSVDVLHRWSVPALAPMATAVPGEVNTIWFKAEEEGDYEGRSTQFSGPSTNTMRTRVRVVSAEEFGQWADRQQSETAAAQAAIQAEVEAGTAPGVALR